MNVAPPGLLVSVRSVAEAEAALAGGADLIDVKEPARGPLGRADDAVIAGVLQAVAGRRPVSAALGELRDAAPCPLRGLAFAKWGLAGAGPDWEDQLQAALESLRAVDAACRPVAVAYADWRRAQAPPPAAVADFAARHAAILLLDTGVKDGSTLLDWLAPPQLSELRKQTRQAGVPIALAGSLGCREIAALADLQPDWFAVRGAACLDGQRGQAIDAGQVRRLKCVVSGP
jgi:uncharacterized protein (UPF0264 family)